MYLHLYLIYKPDQVRIHLDFLKLRHDLQSFNLVNGQEHFSKMTIIPLLEKRENMNPFYPLQKASLNQNSCSHSLSLPLYHQCQPTHYRPTHCRPTHRLLTHRREDLREEEKIVKAESPCPLSLPLCFNNLRRKHPSLLSLFLYPLGLHPLHARSNL